MKLNAQILAVDNDPKMLGMMGKVISQTGAMPRCVASSQLAADLVDRDKFEGVFLDWQMPEMNGVELVRRIRRSKRNTRSPIVMLSQTGSPAALKEGFRAGINLSMEKPLSVQQFRQLLLASRTLMFEERRRYHRVPVLETGDMPVGQEQSRGPKRQSEHQWNPGVTGKIPSTGSGSLREVYLAGFLLPSLPSGKSRPRYSGRSSRPAIPRS